MKTEWKKKKLVKVSAMLLAIVSGFFVVLSGMITIGFAACEGLNGEQSEIERTLDGRLLNNYANYMINDLAGRDKSLTEEEMLRNYDGGNIRYTLMKKLPGEKEWQETASNHKTLIEQTALVSVPFWEKETVSETPMGFWSLLLDDSNRYFEETTTKCVKLDYVLYDDGIFYCFGDHTLYQMDSFYVVEEKNVDILQYNVDYCYYEEGTKHGYQNPYTGEVISDKQLKDLLMDGLRIGFNGLGVTVSATGNSQDIRIKMEPVSSYPYTKIINWEDCEDGYSDQDDADQSTYLCYETDAYETQTAYKLYLSVSDSIGNIKTLKGGLPDCFYQAHLLAGQFLSIRKNCGWVFLFSLFIFCAAFVVLMKTAGWQKGKNTVQLRFWDRIPFGIYTVLMITAVSLLIAAGIGTMYIYLYRNALYDFCVAFSIIAAVLAELVFFLYCMSIAVRMKSKKFWHYTILRYLVKPFRSLGKIFKQAWTAVRAKTPVMIRGLVVFGVISLVEVWVCFISFSYGGGSGLIPVFMWKLVELVVLIVILNQFNKLCVGGKRIAGGDYSHPIDSTKMLPSFKEHAEDLNNVRVGVANAVEEKMKSERFRTELITNVSHDIKTPLTSIINYVDLMKKEQIDNGKLKEYMEVLDRQSLRLKKLIEDLMEASKASTGNLPVHSEVCDTTVMLTQVVGEFSERAKEQQLELVVDCPNPPLNIFVDGRHLWRIIDNLMSNVCKYAMPGTRVYISLEQYHGMVIMTFRNISKDRLHMSSEELMGRFVRGDSSRNTEGNGLGLSIAKSLTELLDGNLAVQIDGDLFKVILSFAEYKEK